MNLFWLSVCAVMFFLLIPFAIYLVIRKVFFKKELPSIRNKHVAIIGGSSGIGKQLAILAASKGAHVSILARNQTRLEEALEVIKQHSISEDQKIQCVSLDVKDYENVQEKLNALDEEVPIYMLVNCAGFAISRRVEDYSVQDIQQLSDINILGTIYPVKALIKKFKERRQGIIVLTGSQASLIGIYGLSVYSATKFAVRGFAESLHMELVPYNVSVTVALPPDTDTPGFEEENKGKPEETLLISGSAGLYQPNVVAEKLLHDSLNGKFLSCVGFESFMLTTLSVGMSPFSSIGELIIQFFLLGLFRIISCAYLVSFHGIIKKSLKLKESKE